MEKEKKVFENVKSCKEASKALETVFALVRKLEKIRGWDFYYFDSFDEALAALCNYVEGYLDALSE